jgi:hypothetical protein
MAVTTESATLKKLRAKLKKVEDNQKTLEAENKELKSRPPTGKESIDPGFKKVPHNDKYESAKYQRTLESGNIIMWILRKKKGNTNQWLDMQIDLRFKNGKAIPGIGGDTAKWEALDEYFEGGDYTLDRRELYSLMDLDD